ncbi:response regulator [Patescibacteria group bacterium]|nr:response regulator [Patescibacteria group bacterium]
MSHVVLIIEDEEPVHRALASILMPDVYTLVTATEGETGLDLALTKHPDLILLDIMLPGIDGIEVLRRLRRDEWGSKAKVVILTNLSDSYSEKEAKSLGVDEYLIKSNVSLEDLVKKIEGYLS